LDDLGRSLTLMSAFTTRSRVGLSDSNDSESMSSGAPSPPEDLPSDGGNNMRGEGDIFGVRSLEFGQASLTCPKR
jgi:hypothetical protein